MAEWLQLMKGELSVDDAGALLSKAAADLQAFLEGRPQAEQRVLDILSKRLDGQFNDETWKTVHDSLTNYLGQDPAYLVAWVAERDQTNRVQSLEKHASPSVVAFLRMILAIYGPELENAYDLWNTLPDDWRTVFRDVFYDVNLQRLHIRVRVVKYNGEQIVIEGSPDSLLRLTSVFVRTMIMVNTPDAFSQDNVNLFFEETKELVKLLTPGEEKESAETSGPEEDSRNA